MDYDIFTIRLSEICKNIYGNSCPWVFMVMFSVQLWPGLMTTKMENTMFGKMEGL